MATATKAIKGSKEYYTDEAFNTLQKDLALKSKSEIPSLKKIVLSIGLGEAKNNRGVIKEGMEVLTLISGQQPVTTIAKKAISGFKIREDMEIGAKVTLRRGKMYDFLTKFINIALPRQRDFHGLSRKKFDGRGNYTVGLDDIKIFPETGHLHSSSVNGLSVVFVTSTNEDEYAEVLLEKMGLPFEEKRK